MRLVLIMAIALATSLHGEPGSNAYRTEADDSKYEQARDAALEQRRRELEADKKARTARDANVPWGLFALLGAGLGFGAMCLLGVLYWRKRSPQVHCPRCHWSGRQTESARTGQGHAEASFKEVAVHVAAEALGVPGGDLALELVKFANGQPACPRCGSYPLIDARNMAAPLPPRKGARSLHRPITGMTQGKTDAHEK